jgi:hypothetical protein
MKMTKYLLAGATFVVFAGLSLSSLAASRSSDVKIVNMSDWKIQELYFSPSEAATWGRDQLKDHVINPGETFSLSQVPCGVWDVKVVDEDDDSCVVESVDICGASTWTINSKDMLSCQASTK